MPSNLTYTEREVLRLVIARVILSKEYTEDNGLKYWLFNQRKVVRSCEGKISLSTMKRCMKRLEDKGYIDRVLVENRMYAGSNLGPGVYVRIKSKVKEVFTCD